MGGVGKLFSSKAGRIFSGVMTAGLSEAHRPITKMAVRSGMPSAMAPLTSGIDVGSAVIQEEKEKKEREADAADAAEASLMKTRTAEEDLLATEASPHRVQQRATESDLRLGRSGKRRRASDTLTSTSLGG